MKDISATTCDFQQFGILTSVDSDVWYLIVLIPDLCHLSYFIFDILMKCTFTVPVYLCLYRLVLFLYYDSNMKRTIELACGHFLIYFSARKITLWPSVNSAKIRGRYELLDAMYVDFTLIVTFDKRSVI